MELGRDIPNQFSQDVGKGFAISLYLKGYYSTTVQQSLQETSRHDYLERKGFSCINFSQHDTLLGPLALENTTCKVQV